MAQTRKQIAIFPDLPRDTKLIDDKGNITPSWNLFFQNLVMALQTNLKPEGFVIPPKTDTEIAQLTGDESNNNIVYDSVNNEFKGNVNGVWKTFTLV